MNSTECSIELFSNWLQSDSSRSNHQIEVSAFQLAPHSDYPAWISNGFGAKLLDDCNYEFCKISKPQKFQLKTPSSKLAI